MSHDFKIVNADTDSISFCKADFSFIPVEERNTLIKEINDLSPEFMIWADDGYYKKVVVVKAKNYVLQDESGEIKIKGSALKAPQKEKALQEFIRAIIDAMLEDRTNYTEIYHKYVSEIMDIRDINRWASRKTITSKTLESERTNEAKVRDAIAGTEYVEGNRAYFYFKSDNTLCLAERFDGDYSREKLLKKLYDTAKIFSRVIPTDHFPNYSLKRNKERLNELRSNLQTRQDGLSA